MSQLLIGKKTEKGLCSHLLNILQRHWCCLGECFQVNSMNWILNNQTSNVKPPAVMCKLFYF